MALLADTIACRLGKIKIVLMALLLLLVVSCKQTTTATIQEKLPFYNTAEFDAQWINEGDTNYSSIHTIENFSLQDQRGKTIIKDSLDGFIYVANFFFTTCSGICSKMTNNLLKLQDTLSDDRNIKLISFTVMPWVDSVQKLNDYGQAHSINPAKWHLLTGDKEQIYHLARASFFAEKGLGLQKTTDEFLHTESMLLIDKKGRIRGIYNATQKPDIERVLDDINVLSKE